MRRGVNELYVAWRRKGVDMTAVFGGGGGGGGVWLCNYVGEKKRKGKKLICCCRAGAKVQRSISYEVWLKQGVDHHTLLWSSPRNAFTARRSKSPERIAGGRSGDLLAFYIYIYFHFLFTPPLQLKFQSPTEDFPLCDPPDLKKSMDVVG